MERPVEEFLCDLDRKIADVLASLEQSEVYRVLLDRNTAPRLRVAVVRQLLLEVCSYGPHLAAATFASIGRMGSRHHFMRPLVKHILEEAPHSDLALRSYVRLGGDESVARSHRISPTAFAVAAVARMLAEHDSPFSYLGYMYLKESTTAVVAVRVREALLAQGDEVEFVDVHADVDEGHSAFLREQIRRIVTEAPEEMAAIDYGFACYASVYPLPVWSAALERARRDLF